MTGKIKVPAPQTQNRQDGQLAVESTKGRQDIQKQARWSRWYRNKLDDMIIQRWAEACSDRHNDCLNCSFLEECQDLIDRLIACMDVVPTRPQEMILKHQRR
jgi:hypothetical protein